MKYSERKKWFDETAKAVKRGAKAQRNLSKNQGTRQQRSSWKQLAARKMRAIPTECEGILYDALIESKIAFNPQVPVGPYIVDCLIYPQWIIEVDGPIHNTRVAYDTARDRYLWDKGYKVLRLTNDSLRCNLSAVIAQIREFIKY